MGLRAGLDESGADHFYAPLGLEIIGPCSP
jgi:hypothetical protein